MESVKETACLQLMLDQEWSNSQPQQQMTEQELLYCQKCRQIFQISAHHTAAPQQM